MIDELIGEASQAGKTRKPLCIAGSVELAVALFKSLENQYACWWGVFVGVEVFHQKIHSLDFREARDIMLSNPTPFIACPLDHGRPEIITRISESWNSDDPTLRRVAGVPQIWIDIKCEACRGSGVKRIELAPALEFVKCQTCNGTGVHREEPC